MAASKGINYIVEGRPYQTRLWSLKQPINTGHHRPLESANLCFTNLETRSFINSSSSQHAPIQNNIMDHIRGHICRSCRARLAAPTIFTKPRSFSTSKTLQIVPPESPYYVDIPESHQAFAPYYRRPKGILPNPRDIFPENRPEKSSPEYIANVTPQPVKKNIKSPSKLSPTAKHKAKMAEQRRTQLREGLTALHARKQADLTFMSTRSQNKQRNRAALLTQSEREDARLTNVSVPSAMKPVTSQTSLAALEAEVATAKAQHAQKLANYQQFTVAKREAKMDALHTLYMNARSFITTESQLRQLLTKQFDDKKRFTNEVADGDSMWQFGPPASVKDMISDATGRPRGRSAMSGEILSSMNPSARLSSSLQGDREQRGRDQERLKRIAEKLSGGKI